jgi:hypothetical protein
MFHLQEDKTKDQCFQGENRLDKSRKPQRKNDNRFPIMLLLFLALLLSTSRDSGMAIPLPLPTQALGIRAADESENRTMFDIILGCASTTFICTWVSVHPNVPPRTTEEYGWKSLLRRLRLMFWALVAPELVLAWSAKQWYVAGKVANTYNVKKGEIDTTSPHPHCMLKIFYKTFRRQESGTLFVRT